MRHRVSSATGTYRGRKVVDLSIVAEKKARKMKKSESARNAR